MYCGYHAIDRLEFRWFGLNLGVSYRREIMSDKVVGKIFVTSWKNYKKFRDNENNRNLDERHVASFRKNGWDIEPITVNKDYVIISGHHRLAADVQAEIDIKYTIADVDYTSTQKKWTERDVIASKAKAGSIAHQNYIQLDEKYVATKILKPNTLVAVITNNYTTGSVAKIKSDDFEFPLEEFIKVDEKLQILSDVLEPARNSKRSSAFLEKAALFMLDNGAVPSTLKDRLDKYSSTIPKIPSIEVGIETLEGIYNRRSAKKMYFSSAYREYLDNRNKKAERT